MTLTVFFPGSLPLQWTRTAWLALLHLVPLVRRRPFSVSPFDFADEDLWSVSTRIDLPRFAPCVVFVEFLHEGWYYALCPGPDRDYVVFRLSDIVTPPGCNPPTSILRRKELPPGLTVWVYRSPGLQSTRSLSINGVRFNLSVSLGISPSLPTLEASRSSGCRARFLITAVEPIPNSPNAMKVWLTFVLAPSGPMFKMDRKNSLPLPLRQSHHARRLCSPTGSWLHGGPHAGGFHFTV